MTASKDTLHVSLVAIPEAMASTLSGIYDALNSVHLIARFSGAALDKPPFAVEIVGEKATSLQLASGLPLPVQRAVADIRRTDIVIVPSLLVPGGDWTIGRYPSLVSWLKEMHRTGATLCSACSGIFLIAEAGLFDRRDATIHWSYANGFRKVFPDIRVHPEKVLVTAGARGELITSGASTSWHDLALHLIAKHAGAAAAHAVIKFLALQSHQDSLAPYVVFEAPRDHGDAVIAEIQDWLQTHFSVANPIEEMVRRSGLPERSFKRRFTKATGYAPITYVQRLRVEEAKRRLERTRNSADDISWQVGYEDPAFFRRLFRRVTQLSPSAYRRKFSMPQIEPSAGARKTGATRRRPSPSAPRRSPRE
jgi:transcriptional regulator GlxA family with amidase domain